MHTHLLLAFASIIANFHSGNAYDDSEFLRGGIKNAMAKNNISRSLLDGLFPSEMDPDPVTPAIVGGEDVNPQEYPVSS